MHLCPDVTSTCENTDGSFICHCHDGYRKTSDTTCDDINECEEDLHDCDENAKCVNLPGSYYCYCKDGYSGGGRKGDCFGKFYETVLKLKVLNI